MNPTNDPASHQGGVTCTVTRQHADRTLTCVRDPHPPRSIHEDPSGDLWVG